MDAEDLTTGEEFNKSLIGAIEIGRKARFIVFTVETSELVCQHEKEIPLSYPNEGWVELKPTDIIRGVNECVEVVCQKLVERRISVQLIKAVGVTNFRETTILWNSQSGAPLYNAIDYSDIRTDPLADYLIGTTSSRSRNHFLSLCGLPIHSQFSALKLRWLIENVPAVQKAIQAKRCFFGTIDSWVIWNLTGGIDSGVHITDVTNASRTMLMNLQSLQWDSNLLRFFHVPAEILPEIHSTSEIYGYIEMGPLKGVPISGCIADQQAILVGQGCLSFNMVKVTYGSSSFLLCNTGQKRVSSNNGLLTTVAYKMGPNAPAFYALEGPAANSGQCIRWLRDNLDLMHKSAEVEDFASSVPNSGDVYFVPAFTGLQSPSWDPKARGILCGLTQHTTKAHICRAALESTCFEIRQILESLRKDCGCWPAAIQADGKMSDNNFLMQLQADMIGVTVIRPHRVKLCGLGAAIMAGLAKGVEIWDIDQQFKFPAPCDSFTPTIGSEIRDHGFQRWVEAEKRSMKWVESREPGPDTVSSTTVMQLSALVIFFLAFLVFASRHRTLSA